MAHWTTTAELTWSPTPTFLTRSGLYCRYYKDWIVDNSITFGAINSKHGVIEFVSQGDNPVGLAAPAVAVRGGSMLITYSYSGPFNVPTTNGGIRAFPGRVA
jgi:hypothetical protein